MGKKKLKRPAMPGAGRPATYDRPRKISLLIEESTLDRLDSHATRLGLLRTTIVTIAIEEWMERR